MQRADIAMYAAKEGGRGVELYEPELDGNSPRRLALAGELRTAIERGEIVLYYQPKVDLRTGRVVGVEALRAGSTPSTAGCRPTSSSRSPSRPA